MVADSTLLEEGRKVLAIERNAIEKTEGLLGEAFVKAVRLVLSRPGNVIFCGVGKSGHVGRKLAATFSSTGTTSFFVHADEAAHGDLGMIRPGDIFVGISFSGESDELLLIIPALKKMGIPIIAMTGRANSSLARVADVSLVTPIEREACPLNLAPTASTTVTMALGSAMK
ncbi:MAG: SIS domain-containing protein, partial [Duodenibacillus sp.]|nr:SIS domain-containing protein [Duodenibacillus sp.]